MGYLKNRLLMIWILVLAAGCSGNRNEQSVEATHTTTKQKDWAIVIHGGAGTISQDLPDSVKKAYKADLDSALSIGTKVLKRGGKGIDAVQKVITYFEDNPKFNAGKGSVFTHDGNHELDAAIMIGNPHQAGSVTGVKTVKNPITLARKVLEKSKHIMFAGEGAEEFAGKMGLERVNQDYFYTEKRYKAWKRAVKKDSDPEGKEQSDLIKSGDAEPYHYFELGTVGCVVLDQKGTLVSGTSTGGLTDKMFGRVGDVPTIGAGTYASDVVAVSMTGIGERIMEAVAGHTVSSYMKFKQASLKKAGDYLLNEVLKPNEAGMIAVDRYGNVYMNMNTTGMFRGTADSEGNHQIAIWK